MNILNKLPQVDRNKIEKMLKHRYIECFKEARQSSEYVDQFKKEENDFCANIEWERFMRYASKMRGMEEVMDILGIDYSGWTAKI